MQYGAATSFWLKQSLKRVSLKQIGFLEKLAEKTLTVISRRVF